MVKKYIDNLFFTWSVMGKQNNTAKFGVPGFFDCSGVPGCSGVFRGVPGCSGVFRSVPVFRCSGVPGFSTCPKKEVRVPKLLNFRPQSLCALTDQECEGSGVENELLRRQNLVLFAGRKIWRRKIVANCGATMPQTF